MCGSSKIDGYKYMWDEKYRKQIQTFGEPGKMEEAYAERTAKLREDRAPDLTETLIKRGPLFAMTGSRAGSFFGKFGGK